MLNVIMLLLILLENSLAINFPYNMLALPYLTFLAYQRGKNGVFEVLLMCIIIASNKGTFVELGVVFMLVYLISYFLAKIVGYEHINIFYYTVMQVIIYGTYLYGKLPYFSIGNLVILAIGYLLVNYIYIKTLRKKL